MSKCHALIKTSKQHELMRIKQKMLCSLAFRPTFSRKTARKKTIKNCYCCKETTGQLYVGLHCFPIGLGVNSISDTLYFCHKHFNQEGNYGK